MQNILSLKTCCIVTFKFLLLLNLIFSSNSAPLDEFYDIDTENPELSGVKNVDDIVDFVLADPNSDLDSDVGEEDFNEEYVLPKRKRFTTSLMGIHVAYPEYMRLVALQKKAMQLDKIIREAREVMPLKELMKDELWRKIITLRQALTSILPGIGDVVYDDISKRRRKRSAADADASDNEEDARQKRSAVAEEDDLRSMAVEQKQKRFTVEFMGVRVSYPQYVRLRRLQEKVIKLDKLMKVLRAKNSPEKLNKLPQWKTLVDLHESLKPLLPIEDGNQLEDISSFITDTPQLTDENTVMKRTPFDVDFMGVRVSYPQYIRLKALQEKVIRLDMLMTKLRSYKSEEELSRYPNWRTLVDLHTALSKLLPNNGNALSSGASAAEPQAYYGEEVDLKVKKSVDFNGVQVSIPQYSRLMNLQAKVMKLDAVLRKIASTEKVEELKDNPTWIKLVDLRESLQKLLPEGHPDFAMNKRGGPSMDFNGVQVSYPQYLHLMEMQEKVMKLDAVMNHLQKTLKDPERLKQNPEWQKLEELRNSLQRLMPQGK